MELIEIKGLFSMDKGAPCPMIISNDTEMFIIFYTDMEDFLEIHERNTIYDSVIVVLNFERYIKYTFGMPGNETIQGHPYSKLGMKSYSFYELRNSDLIERLREVDKMHPYYNPDKWKKYKHYILTFHDNMFECIAHSFTINEKHTSLYNQASSILTKISAKGL